MLEVRFQSGFGRCLPVRCTQTGILNFEICWLFGLSACYAQAGPSISDLAERTRFSMENKKKAGTVARPTNNDD